MTTREWARRVMQRMRLPVPERSRTLHVHLPPGVQTPDFKVQCTCYLVAQYVWRLAHEQRCTSIEIHNGPAHKHTFDTVDLFAEGVLRHTGRWPRVMTVAGRTPPQMATRGHQALGNQLEERRILVPVTGVSGTVPAPKES
mgnify:FL=1